MPQTVLWIAEGYLALGALIALAFVSLGIARVDPAAKGSSVIFRVLVLPGATLLWPLVLYRWATAKPQEHA